MFSTFDPHQAPIGLKSIPVTASVLTSASAKAAGLGPFRFLFIQTSTTFSVTHSDGTTCSYNDLPAGSYLWVQGEFVHAIGSATSLFAIK